MKLRYFSIVQFICIFFIGAVFILFSCSKEDHGVANILDSPNKETTPVDYDLNRLNGIDQAKVKFSKILANAIAKHPPIKKMLFETVFDQQTKKSKEVFVLDLIAPTEVRTTESFKDLLVTYGDVTIEEFDDLVNTFCQDYPNVVVDVPAYVEWAYSYEGTSERFAEIYQNYPFTIMPNTHEPNANGKWTGYGDLEMNGHSSLYEIASDATYEDVIPFIVKAAERTLVFSDEGLTLINGRNVIESYIGSGLTEAGIRCFVEQLGELKARHILCGRQYELISFEDLSKIKQNCGFFFMMEEECDDGIDNDDDGLIDCEDPDCNCDEEICDDGVDNDDDGLIDCEDPDCNCEEEICDDGIDNDGDGLIDSDDPDCIELEICCDGIDNDGDGDIDEEDSDCCYRDCRTDHNFLLAHKFDEIWDAHNTTFAQVPGGERLTQLKYQITTMEKSEPGGTPQAVSNNQIVVARTYILYCETPTVSALDALTPYEISTLCLDDNDLYYNQTVRGFLGGLVFNGNPQDLGYGNGAAQGFITFNLRDEIYVRIMHTKWVIEPMLYLRYIRDWDASLIANELRMSIYEIDEAESEIVINGTGQITSSTSVSGKFGTKVKSGSDTNNNTENSSETSYNFSTSSQSTVSNTYTITAKDVYYLGDLALKYCDEEAHNGESYNISIEALGTDRKMHRIYEENNMLDWWNIIEDEEN